MNHCTQLILLGMTLAASVSMADLKAKSVKAFRGGEGVTVTVVRLDKGTAKEAVVKVTGTESELDGKPNLAEIREWDGNEDYSIKWKDRRSNILVKRSGFELYIPGKSKGISLAYDQKLSEAANGAEIIAEYQKGSKQ